MNAASTHPLAPRRLSLACPQIVGAEIYQLPVGLLRMRVELRKDSPRVGVAAKQRWQDDGRIPLVCKAL